MAFCSLLICFCVQSIEQIINSAVFLVLMFTDSKNYTIQIEIEQGLRPKALYFTVFCVFSLVFQHSYFNFCLAKVWSRFVDPQHRKIPVFCSSSSNSLGLQLPS